MRLVRVHLGTTADVRRRARVARTMNAAPIMRVLVIDDDDSLRAMISELLIEIGYELVGFANLDEIVDNASIRMGRDDLILIDLDARQAADLRAPLTNAFPHTVVITVGDGDYEAIPRVQLRKRVRRARAPQRARATRATGTN